MLNIIKSKLNTSYKNGSNNKNVTIDYKNFVPAIRDWKNSIYVYNKNALNSIPSTTILITKIIKSYFSLFNKSLEKKMRTKRLLLRFRRLSSNKIYIESTIYRNLIFTALHSQYIYI